MALLFPERIPDLSESPVSRLIELFGIRNVITESRSEVGGNLWVGEGFRYLPSLKGRVCVYRFGRKKDGMSTMSVIAVSQRSEKVSL